VTDTPGIGSVHLSEAQLTQLAQRCEDTGASIASGMSQLMAQIDSLNAGAFQGVARDAFQGATYQLNDGLTTILRALDTLAGKMSNASTQFGVHDGDAAADITRAAQANHDTTAMQVMRGLA
jgi:WXG100 family type VII secretion target